MKRVLLAYDGSPGAALALSELTRSGLVAPIEARVFTVADVWLPPAPEREMARSDHPNYAAAQAKASALLAEAKTVASEGAERLHELFPQWTLTHGAAADSPAWGIMAEGRRWGAGLIAIGSHGRNPLERFFLGSVSYKIAAEARCSVRIARGHPEKEAGPSRLLIGIDGSADSERAIQEVLARRWPQNSVVALVTVVDPKIRTSVLRKSEGASGFERVEDWIEPLHRDLRARFEQNNLECRTRILEGDPKNAILREAAETKVETIFLGARGLDHAERLYLGTLASAISTRAHCTVELVRSILPAEPAESEKR